MKCPDCQRSIPADSRFCSYCGIPVQTCRTCGIAYDARARFCGDCGGRLSADDRRKDSSFEPPADLADDVVGLLYDPDNPSRHHELNIDDTTVGAGGHNDVVIDDETVSWNHAVILTRDGHLRLQDSASTNGTFVGDQQVHKPRRLAHGDALRFGEARFQLWLRSDMRDEA